MPLRRFSLEVDAHVALRPHLPGFGGAVSCRADAACSTVSVLMWSLSSVGAAADAVRAASFTHGADRSVVVRLRDAARPNPGRPHAWNRVRRHSGMRVAVVVPAASSVTADTTRASVIARGPFAEFSATTVSGRVTVVGGADRLTVHNGSGPVSITGARVARVTTQSGRLSLTRTDDMQAATMGGDIRARDFGGSGWLRTVSGDITVHATRPGHLWAESVSGDLTLSVDRPTLLDDLDVRLATTSGSVRLPPGTHRCGESVHRCRVQPVKSPEVVTYADCAPVRGSHTPGIRRSRDRSE